MLRFQLQLLFLLILRRVNSFGIVDYDNKTNGGNYCVDCKASSYEPVPFDAPVSLDSCVAGPPCTMGAHNDFEECSDECPGYPQPADGPFIENTTFNNHTFADQFIMDFFIYYVKDNETFPPYEGAPSSSEYTMSLGRTWYDINIEGGFMRETYYHRCLPIFPAPPLNNGDNNYSCSYYSWNNNNTAYTVFYDDRPEGAPECCIIANPFHCPAQNFWMNLPHKSQNIMYGEVIDYRGVDLGPPTGNVTYSFLNEYDEDGNSVPFSFFFRGLPFLYPWCYQEFDNFTATAPSPDDYQIPDVCFADDVTTCPGWDPWVAETCGTKNCTDDESPDHAIKPFVLNKFIYIFNMFIFCICLY